MLNVFPLKILSIINESLRSNSIMFNFFKAFRLHQKADCSDKYANEGLVKNVSLAFKGLMFY